MNRFKRQPPIKPLTRKRWKVGLVVELESYKTREEVERLIKEALQDSPVNATKVVFGSRAIIMTDRSDGQRKE